jgi:hypothetical protein
VFNAAARQINGDTLVERDQFGALLDLVTDLGGQVSQDAVFPERRKPFHLQ